MRCESGTLLHIATQYSNTCIEQQQQKISYIHILYFAWEDQSDATYRILHTLLINCITGQIQHTWANTGQLCREFICGMLRKQLCKSLKPAKLILRVHSTARNRLYNTY